MSVRACQICFSDKLARSRADRDVPHGARGARISVVRDPPSLRSRSYGGALFRHGTRATVTTDKINSAAGSAA